MSAPLNAIAIVGMAGRFPGASTPEEMWANVKAGRDCIRHFTDAELTDAHADDVRRAPNFVRARPVLDDVDKFDAEFFGVHPREAALMDPQHRIFLECAWEALEDAGCDPSRYKGAVGVFAGCSLSTYFLHHVCGDRETIERFTSGFQVDNYAMLTGAGADFLATRAAYKLDLRGPAINIATACSTSLLAVAQACQSLLLYQSDLALAGAASISFPQERGYLAQEGGMVSPDGRCRPFDAEAAGTVFGSGCGVVALKRLEDALADRDDIYAVIRATAVNNDGAGKVGYTAPSVDGQAAVIAAAHAIAGVSARSIGYVEAHGTATPLGDPIEFAGLTKAFRETTGERGFCRIGSTKANLGHLDAAAGVTGLMRAALSLRDGVIPPLLHFSAPNPALNLGDSPFRINAAEEEWTRGPGGEPRRAGVSSFGVGGTNVHAVLEEAPVVTPRVMPARPVVIRASARTEADLARVRDRLASHIETSPAPIADIAFTLNGRKAFPWRSAIVAADAAEAAAKLRAAVGAQAPASPPPVVFMFPGQGSQYPGMGRALYDAEPVFRRAMIEGAEIVRDRLGEDLIALLYDSAPAADDAPHPIRSTIFAQPALFLVEHALARLWMSRGVTPAAMMGHSVGELVAACLSGVIRFEDAVAAICFRARLMQDLPTGAMLGVRMSESALRPMLPPQVNIAAVNAPQLCVASGPFDAIAELEARLTAADGAHRRLHTSHAFHSAMVETAVAPFEAHLRTIRLGPPQIPFVSCVTGQWIAEADAVSPAYWARHARETVRFADALATAASLGAPALLEVGPGRTLTTFALQTLARDAARCVAASLPDAASDVNAAHAMLEAEAALWTANAPMDERPDPMARRTRLPTYPFARKRHWIDAPAPRRSSLPALAPAPLTPAPVMEVVMPQNTAPAAAPDALAAELAVMLESLSGAAMSEGDRAASFLELGFDSLFLAQFATQVQKEYGVKITFRQLLNDIPSIAALERHLAKSGAAAKRAATPALTAIATPTPMAGPSGSAPGGDMQELFRAQIQAMPALFQQQQAMLGGGAAVAMPSPQPTPKPAVTLPEPSETPSRFQVYRSGGQTASVTDEQRRFIAELTARAEARTPTAKRATQANRATLADPRTASGFRAEWKELVYPIVAARSKGSKIWDLDGNEYIDLVNGYGQTMFGHAPDFVLEAIAEQMGKGFAIGPQSPLAGEVASLFSEMTGNERVTFCNTGSEAVMAAMRVARAVTGRDKVAVFTGAYHGQFDEVLVRPGRRAQAPIALPVAPGIPQDSVSNIVVLPYAAPESLEWVRQSIGDLAAVIVEPVQSRNPGLQPRDFAAELRRITEADETALVFDEVVTGFRAHPGGMQALWGVRADLATYGKVVGGGMPIGVLAGKPRFMDALDGGFWSYGDDSVPETAPTFFAGTFVRHPLVLAAARAVLLHLKAEGPALQERLAARTAALTARMNAHLARRGVETRIASFSSWSYLNFIGEDKLSSLLFQHMRVLGVNAQEGFPCFLTTAHSDADIEHVAASFEQSIDALQSVGILADKRSTDGAPAAIAETRAPADCPATEGQREIWLAAQLGDEASCAFNESVSLELDGPLDADALFRALNGVVARRDALRGSFPGGGERMRIAPNLDLPPRIEDIGEDGEAFAGVLREEAETPFDLERGPLIRARLLRRSPQRHTLVITAHHIVCDGWSFNVVIDELAALYNQETGQGRADLPAPLPFAEYAGRRTGGAGDEAFWLGEYQRLPAPLDLPTDRPRPAVKTFRGSTVNVALSADVAAAAKKAGARHGATLFGTLLGVLHALIARLAQQNDVVIGVPMAGQAALDEESLVGHCVNFLPIRADYASERSLSDHVRSVNNRLRAALDHQGYTFGTLVRKLNVPRTPNRTPLTDVQFNLERMSASASFNGLRASYGPNPKAFVNFDLFFNMIEHADGLRIDVDYSTDLYDEATIRRWLAAFETLLKAFAEDAAQPAGAPALLSAAEKERITGAASPAPARKSIHALFADVAAGAPHLVALKSGSSSISYGELDAQANRLARRLQALGVRPGDRVAMTCGRSADAIVAILAILKAGAAYAPFDPSHPVERLRLMIADCEPRLVLTDTGVALSDAGGGSQVLTLSAAMADAAAASSEPVVVERGANDLAYVMYTSGSTGRPKGALIPHRAVVRLVRAQTYAHFGPGETILHLAPLAFDASTFEIWGALLNGGALAVVSTPKPSLAEIAAAIAGHQATTAWFTAGLFHAIVDENVGALAPLRQILAGGDVLSPPHVAKAMAALPHCRFINGYGPTENTTFTCCYDIPRDHPAGQPIPIGRPIAGTQVYICAADGGLAPIGVMGELFAGGDGVALGYLNRPDLTAEKFTPDRFGQKPGALLYRTGDLARWRADGVIEFLGRGDEQVKINGFRVEPGEIEAAIAAHPGVAEAVVIVKTAANGSKSLHAFIKPVAGADSSTLPDAIAARCAQTLPAHMVPRTFAMTTAMPITANGKVDRKALAAMTEDRQSAPPEVATLSPVEETLSRIWRDVLGAPSVGVGDRLFALGADSLHIFRIVARAKEAGLNLEARQLMSNPTIADLAKAIAGAAPAKAPSAAPSLSDFRHGARR
ncbi:MAG: amino acid adenylation domain-containing protein [Hyphomicrobiales bacterium]|nr:amino acid adenylation domain-containing protein [Hyphomicrobiales bacterium]